MLLDTQNISLIYDFWKLNGEGNYLHEARELLRRLIDSDIIDAEYIQNWIPDLVRVVDLWTEQSFQELDTFYATLLTEKSLNDKLDTLLRFLYDIQLYDMVQYLLEKNVQYYKQRKLVSATMNAFHEACIYGFSHVCSLYVRSKVDVNETFSLVYENFNTNEKEMIRNVTALQLACVWAKYFPKRLASYAQTVRTLLEHGARVNMTSTELTTSLHWTCRAKHTTQLAQDLIEHGACVTACDKLNIQPIHYACWTRNRILVDVFLSKGIPLSVVDDFGRTAVHFLCMPAYTEATTKDDRQGQFDLLKYILSDHHQHSRSIDLTKADHQGRTLLTYACISQNLALMELLLEHQRNLLNKATVTGRTPLMVAIEECFLNGIEYLLRQPDLDRNACDAYGNTAVHYACMSADVAQRSTILQLLINDKNGSFDLERRTEQLVDPFMLCTVYHSVDLCRLLMEKNVLLTKQDIYSRQSLHVACQLGNYELVSLLINSSKVDINALDANNRSCLFYAMSYGDEKLVNLLIEHNVKINIRDAIEDTPLHVAVQHPTNAYELTTSLLTNQEGKELVNESAADGMKPLSLAAACRQPGVVHLLLKNGADPKGVDNEQHTALHLACRSGCMQSAFYLIEFGGLDVNEFDCYQQTPLFYAFSSNDYDLVDYLLFCGAKLDVRDNQHYLPIHAGILLSKADEAYNPNLIDLYQGKHEDLLNDQSNESKMSALLLACMQGRLEIVKHLILNYQIDIMAQCSNGHTALHYASLFKNGNALETIDFLMQYGCTYEKVDQPKGSFLSAVIPCGNRQAAMYFIEHWLKTNPDINELHDGATILDLLYQRAQCHHDDLEVEHLRQLLERGARLHASKAPTHPCPLINDCPLFYLTVLEYNGTAFADATIFIIHLLNTVSLHRDNVLLLNTKKGAFISVCEYFLKIAQVVHYFFTIEQFTVIINQYLIPQLSAEQSTEQVEALEKELGRLRSAPLKLSEIARKSIRDQLTVPTPHQFQQLEVTPYLVEFLSECTF